MVYSRREIVKFCGLAGLGIATFPLISGVKSQDKMIKRSIPSSEEMLPVVGLGTWQTFDVGNSKAELAVRKEVLMEMYRLGGTVIDSSPMYGSSEKVVGQLMAETNFQDRFFYATKVWTSGKQAGIDQMDSSFKKMRRSTMDLMQIHNLVDWQTHVKTLKAWKEKGKIRYWGITHYTDSSHSSLEKIIAMEKPDFAQFNYSIRSRNAEKSLFESCQKHNTAVIINQPYESGSLFRITKDKPLPDWCEEYGIQSWGQFFLKFILSHEAVTCVIPGTSKPKHTIDNMMAGYGRLPDVQGRERMIGYLKTL